MTTPTADRFYMPPEWYPHQRCWMGFPCRPQSWPFALERARAQYLLVAQAIAQFEPVTMVAVPAQLPEAQQACGNHVEVLPMSFNDAWLRDMGPTFVINPRGDVAGVSWQFNAWGGSHPDHEHDATFAQRLLAQLNLPCYTAPLVLEGGAIHVDGEGTALTSEDCLLNPNRNGRLSRAKIESLLRAYLGVTQVIWLGEGLQDDETSGHVDNLACFVRPGVVVALSTQDPQDSNYAALQDNLQRLRQARDAKGRVLEVVTIEQPAYRADDNGLRLALSYLNFYIANGGVVIPSFADPADSAALATLTRLFPERRVVAVPTLDLVHGGGGIHCITQQQPAKFG